MVVCVLPAIFFASRMSTQKLILIFITFLFSWIFLVVADKALIKSRVIPDKWAYRFNPYAILGLWVFGIPIEEHVFIITSVFLPITMWEVIKTMDLPMEASIVVGALVIILLVMISPIMHHLDV